MPQYWLLQSLLQSPLLECDKEKKSSVEFSKQLQNVVFAVFHIAENYFFNKNTISFIVMWHFNLFYIFSQLSMWS